MYSFYTKNGGGDGTAARTNKEEIAVATIERERERVEGVETSFGGVKVCLIEALSQGLSIETSVEGFDPRVV